MGLEVNPKNPDDLNENFPLETDPAGEGDDHLRNIKNVVKETGMSIVVPYVFDSGNGSNVEALVNRDIPEGKFVYALAWDAQSPETFGGTFVIVSSGNSAFTDIQLSNGNWARRIQQESIELRNYIVDGRFDYWFEGTAQTSSGYGSDTMWLNSNTGGTTKTHSQQALIAGVDLPAIDNSTAEFFSRTEVVSANTTTSTCRKIQRIEKVRSLAGKKVNLSLYAKADAVKNISLSFDQLFGTGGSPSSPVQSILAKKQELTTSWKKYNFIVDIPSIEGKILGTDNNDSLQLNIWFEAGSALDSQTDSLGNQDGTFDIACVQITERPFVIPFIEEDAQKSLDRVNRYYQVSTYFNRTIPDLAFIGGKGVQYNSNQHHISLSGFVTKRTDTPSIRIQALDRTFNAYTLASAGLGSTQTPDAVNINSTGSGRIQDVGGFGNADLISVFDWEVDARL